MAAAAAAAVAAAVLSAPPDGGAPPAAPDGAAPPAPDPRLGLVVNTPSPAVTLRELEGIYAKASSSGIGRSNVYMFWDIVEPERDEYDWKRYDALMALHEEHGLRATLYFSVVNGRSLGPFPGWIGNPSLKSIPADHLADAVDEALSRYPAVDSVVIAAAAAEHFRHRERDIPLYEDLFAGFYNATKAAHPGVGIGNSFALHGVLDKNMEETVRRLSAGDFVAFTYRPTDPLNSINRTPEEAAADLRRMLDMVPEGGRAALLEVGWSTSPDVLGSEEDQAAFARELLGFYAENGDRLEFVTWYRLYDRPEGTCEPAEPVPGAESSLGNSTFVAQRLGSYICGAGLLYADGGGAKPAWDAFAGGGGGGGGGPSWAGSAHADGGGG